jgi:membrane AbrB-like protein
VKHRPSGGAAKAALPDAPSFTLALLIGAAGGAVFYTLGLPLPWTLGAMAASAGMAIAGRGWLMPLPVREFARPVIGVMAGSAFTPAVAASLADWWPAILTMLAYTLVMLFLGWFVFRRFFRLDRTTAFFASAPGGLAELTLLGGSLGGDLRSLVLVHSVRVVAIVFSVPFILQAVSEGFHTPVLAPAASAPSPLLRDWAVLTACAVLGFVLGRRFKFPGGVMIPALLLSAVAHAAGLTHSAPPYWLVALVQIVIGSIAGSRFVDVRWRDMMRVLVGAIVWAMVLVGSAVCAAAIGSTYLERPMAVLLLAFVPGGMAEMTIISYAIGIEVAFVVTCQVCRIMAIYVTAPVIFGLLGRRRSTE